MLHSMTGFGRGSYRDEDFSVVIEIKAVNHRYSEFSIRMPHYLNALEDKIKKNILYVYGKMAHLMVVLL